MGGTFPVQLLPACFNLCVCAVKPQSPADPCPRSSGRIPSPWLWGFGEPMDVLACPACSVLGCGSLVAPAQQLQQLQQPLAKPIPQHTVSSWLREQEGPRGAPRGFPPCRVPFICCSADVGFGSCLTCINYRATAPSLWQIQLWSSCPESAVPEAELCLCPRWVQLCPDHLHISCAHVDRLSLAGKV